MRRFVAIFLGLLLLLGEVGVFAVAEEPGLPAGLGGGGEPPPLPSGLTPEAESTSVPMVGEDLPLYREGLPDLAGFFETRGGVRTREDPEQKDASIGETRLQTQLDKSFEDADLRVVGDFLYDAVLEKHRVELETGRGLFDLREMNLLLRPSRRFDIKLGRQVLTWGVGDLVFINDLFPKDWNSFFIGRDVEYLKAPSDALKLSFFSEAVNLDLVYTPNFDADRYIDGRRVSYFSPALRELAGRNAVIEAERPNSWFTDDETAVRLYRNIEGVEAALYGYFGYWKSPGGSDPDTGRVLFPALSAYGASLRGALGGGIGSLELGYYDSRDDSQGNDPFVNNSEFRLLLGFEREVASDFTAALQYYLEHMLDHEGYLQTLPEGFAPRDEDRHVATLRLTKLLMQQYLKLSLFVFYSPSDEDAYFRPNVHYKFSDALAGELGGNVFTGKARHTFFGQFENCSNVYTGLRYSF